GAEGGGVVHGEVKPRNVILADRAPGARLMDFGASKFLRDEETTRMTGENQVLGTPLYMAPEQIVSPREVAPPADLYALGAVLFEMLVGHAPFASAPGAALLLAKVAQPAPRLGDLGDVPARLSALVDSALTKH